MQILYRHRPTKEGEDLLEKRGLRESSKVSLILCLEITEWVVEVRVIVAMLFILIGAYANSALENA